MATVDALDFGLVRTEFRAEAAEGCVCQGLMAGIFPAVLAEQPKEYARRDEDDLQANLEKRLRPAWRGDLTVVPLIIDRWEMNLGHRSCSLSCR